MRVTTAESAHRLSRIAALLDEAPVVDPRYDQERRALVREIAGYLLPRLEHPDAPLVVAVAGGSGAGKSHLVNSLTGTMHSPESSLRPTTRSPILIASTADRDRWQTWRARLRAAAPGTQIVEDGAEVVAGADFVDLPADHDDDAVSRMLAVADLLIVVASPARYADSGTWELIVERHAAAQPVWVVVNRATGPEDELGADLKRRLKAAGHDVPVFLLPMGDGGLVSVLRARLIDAAGPGRSALLDPAIEARTRHVLGRVAELAAPLDELRVRGDRLKRLADAEYSSAATALRALIAESGLGAGAAAAPWPDVAERLAGVVTRRVGVAAERTASMWHMLDDGNALLAGGGHELWRHPPDTAHAARQRLLQWEQDVAVIVNRRSRRALKPHRLREVVAVTRALALGGAPKITWRMNRRLREGIEPAAEESRMSLADLAAGIVSDDERRFLVKMGLRPSTDLVTELRGLAEGTDPGSLRAGEPIPVDERERTPAEVALDA